MKRTNIRKYIKNRPYLLDPWRLHSYEEAVHAWESAGYPAAITLLENARIKSGKTPEAWRQILGMNAAQIDKWERKRCSRVNIPRRVFVLAAILTVLTLFFSCTSPGRSIAYSAYHAVVQFINDHIIIRSDKHMDQYSSVPAIAYGESNENEPIQFSSIPEAIEHVEHNLYYLEDYQDLIESITLYPVVQPYLQTVYLMEDDTRIIVEQMLQDDIDDSMVSIEKTSAEYMQFSSEEGVEVYGVYTPEDSLFTGMIVGEVLGGPIIITNVASKDAISDYLEPLAIAYYYS